MMQLQVFIHNRQVEKYAWLQLELNLQLFEMTWLHSLQVYVPQNTTVPQNTSLFYSPYKI